MVNLDRCNGNCNSFGDPSGRICVAKKMTNKNIKVFNTITRTNILKTLTKQICGRKCKVDGTKFKSKVK